MYLFELKARVMGVGAKLQICLLRLLLNVLRELT